ncbi:MAG: hypothetical protein K9M98_07485 [Cephaloticoccus sp.]|nr:hypothetical protein [Cephaloticoccus sp.]MCF7760332.1 hypothetical protein [Cephaloticoccus sp.]
MNSRLLFALALLGFAGCSTFEQRSKEKAAVFSQLETATQEKLRQGEIEIGYTPDMVFIALGKPDYKSAQITAENREEIWTYNSYFSEYRGTETAGYRRIIDYDPVKKTYIVYYEPVRVDVYREHVEDRIRITFRGGKVVVIEQAK